MSEQKKAHRKPCDDPGCPQFLCENFRREKEHEIRERIRERYLDVQKKLTPSRVRRDRD